MAKRQFDYQGYPCAPTDLSERSWFYVMKEGLVVCARSANGIPTEQAVISWRLVKRALTDHEKAKERSDHVGSPKP